MSIDGDIGEGICEALARIVARVYAIADALPIDADDVALVESLFANRQRPDVVRRRIGLRDRSVDS